MGKDDATYHRSSVAIERDPHRSSCLAAIDGDLPGLDRAYEIARTGRCSTILHIRNQLAREGYQNGRVLLSTQQVTERLLRLMADARRRQTG